MLILSFDSLDSNLEVDVIVVGDGVAGISIVTLLKKEGLSVAVLEARRIGSYVTESTTAKVSYTSSLIYSRVLSQFCKEFGLKFKDAYFTGFNKIIDIVDDLNIDCDLRRIPFYILSEDETKTDMLDNELNALKELNILAKIVNNVPCPFEKINKALVHENQLEFTPIKYLCGLTNYIDGSFVFENSRVLDIKEVDGFKIAKTENGSVKGKNIVIATNTPIYDPDGIYKHLDQVKSHSLGISLEKDVKDIFAVFNLFHTLRSSPSSKGEILVFLGDHRSIDNLTDRWDFYKNLRNYSQDLFNVKSFQYFWSGRDNLTPNGVTIIR
ncbi:MAG: FAD-dependent oxidoreductase [Methanobrevibacter sp.]|jgi:glycine/D-amino acid oxidase-like deaminating enzyme|nr:FAD-dependent oxidoreductase [Methanobrevibacter sp.]